MPPPKGYGPSPSLGPREAPRLNNTEALHRIGHEGSAKTAGQLERERRMAIMFPELVATPHIPGSPAAGRTPPTNSDASLADATRALKGIRK